MIDYRREKIKIALIYATFGTIGIVTHFIPLPSATIVFYRALLGGIFIAFAAKLSNDPVNVNSIVSNIKPLFFTGFFMGLNWVLQFEAFRVSTVAIGTVCYNTMPIFLVIIASFIFRERLTIKSLICIVFASIGIILVSNVLVSGIRSNEVLGCVYGILGAIFYALILISNRYLSGIETRDKIVFQFAFSALIMLIYVAFMAKESFVFNNALGDREKIVGLICIILLGIFHTGFCYVHYFNAVSRLRADTVAILTYIDPATALLLSYFVLKEKMTILQFIGAILIFASTITNELIKDKKE